MYGSALLVLTTLVPTHQQSFAIGAHGPLEEFIFAITYELPLTIFRGQSMHRLCWFGFDQISFEDF